MGGVTRAFFLRLAALFCFGVVGVCLVVDVGSSVAVVRALGRRE